MESYIYPNQYPNDVSKYGLYVTANGNFQTNLLLKMNSTSTKLSKEIERTLSMFKPSGDYSIFTGYCGTALLYLLKFKKTNDNVFLDKALELADNAVANLKNKRISFLNGDAGPLALSIVLNKLKGQETKSDFLIKQLLELNFQHESHPDEVLYGRAGYLYSLLFVDKFYGPVIPVENYREVIHYIIKSGWKRAKLLKLNVALSYEWHDKNYFGAAHGIAGILYTLLCADQMLSEDEKNILIPNTLEWLMQQKHPSGNYLSSENSSKDRLVQWCHGAPGFVHLFLRAYKVYGENSYLEHAIDAGDVIWENGLLAKGYSICHGVSGNAYSFIALYNETKDINFLFKAACFADWCTKYPKNEGMKPDRPYSLYEGIAGIDYFLTDIQNLDSAAFPGYEI